MRTQPAQRRAAPIAYVLPASSPIRVPSFQLVLQFRGASIQDLDEVLEVEAALFEMLGDGEELAGHDIGERARNIFIATDDPDATFRRLMPFLERAHLLAASGRGGAPGARGALSRPVAARSTGWVLPG